MIPSAIMQRSLLKGSSSVVEAATLVHRRGFAKNVGRKKSLASLSSSRLIDEKIADMREPKELKPMSIPAMKQKHSAKRVKEYKDKGLDLLDKEVGSFDLEDDDKNVKSVFRVIQNSEAKDADSCNLILNLAERLTLEMKLSKTPIEEEQWEKHWLCHPRWCNMIYNLWLEASNARLDVDSPADLVKRSHRIADRFGYCLFLQSCYGGIMDVAIQRTTTHYAPIAARDILEVIKAERKKQPFCDPDDLGVRHYNKVMDAWANSRRSEAIDEMNKFLEVMHSDGVEPDSATYDCFVPLDKNMPAIWLMPLRNGQGGSTAAD